MAKLKSDVCPLCGGKLDGRILEDSGIYCIKCQQCNFLVTSVTDVLDSDEEDADSEKNEHVDIKIDIIHLETEEEEPDEPENGKGILDHLKNLKTQLDDVVSVIAVASEELEALQNEFYETMDEAKAYVEKADRLIAITPCECEKVDISAKEYKRGLYYLLKEMDGVNWEDGAKLMQFVTSHKIVEAEK